MVGRVRSSDFRAVAAVIVQGFSLATSVRGFGGDGQSCRSKSAREHQDQQQSGGQAVHRGWSRSSARIGYGEQGCKFVAARSCLCAALCYCLQLDDFAH